MMIPMKFSGHNYCVVVNHVRGFSFVMILSNYSNLCIIITITDNIHLDNNMINFNR